MNLTVTKQGWVCDGWEIRREGDRFAVHAPNGQWRGEFDSLLNAVDSLTRAKELQENPSPLPEGMSEADFQARVISLAQANGFRCYHTWDSRKSQPGFPDLAILRDDTLIFLELKSASGRVRPEQQEWIDALSKVEVVRATVARPQDWPDVVEMLK